MSDKARIAAAIELLNTQKIVHASLIGPDHPVLIEVERVLAVLEAPEPPDPVSPCEVCGGLHAVPLLPDRPPTIWGVVVTAVPEQETCAECGETIERSYEWRTPDWVHIGMRPITDHAASPLRVEKSP